MIKKYMKTVKYENCKNNLIKKVENLIVIASRHICNKRQIRTVISIKEIY